VAAPPTVGPTRELRSDCNEGVPIDTRVVRIRNGLALSHIAQHTFLAEHRLVSESQQVVVGPLVGEILYGRKGRLTTAEPPNQREQVPPLLLAGPMRALPPVNGSQERPFVLQEPARPSDLRCHSYSSNGDSADEFESVACHES